MYLTGTVAISFVLNFTFPKYAMTFLHYLIAFNMQILLLYLTIKII